TLAARAKERADDYYRMARNPPLERAWTGALPALSLGPAVQRLRVGERGAGVLTDAEGWPDRPGAPTPPPDYPSLQPASGSGGGGITLRESDLNPTGPISIFEVIVGRGLVVPAPIAGGLGQLTTVDADETHVGMVNYTGTQNFGGNKVFRG